MTILKSIWLSTVFLILLLTRSIVAYVPHNKAISTSKKYRRRFDLPNTLMSDEEAMLLPDVTVRFLNAAKNGRDVVATAKLGDNLLAVGDANGVELPRACRTGLCGSCTCVLKDPRAVKTSTNPKEGFATIRACSTKCFLPPGETEMIIDVNVMRQRATAKSKSERPDYGQIAAKETFSNPMARFSGNWEKEFRPQWELGTSGPGMGMGGGGSNPRQARKCPSCRGKGRTLCYNCEGIGKVTMSGYSETCQCMICVGMRSVPCATCQGRGTAGKARVPIR